MCNLLANNIVNYQPSRKYHQAERVEPLEPAGLLRAVTFAQLVNHQEQIHPIGTFVEGRGKVTHSGLCSYKTAFKGLHLLETKREIQKKKYFSNCKQHQLHPN